MSTLTPQKTGTAKKEHWKAKKNDIILAVIGRTGAGKSGFIGHARNDPTLRTSKHDVPRGYRLHGHPRFGERIVLVDTPGFDGNQPVEDEKVVKRIQEWYKNNYKASLLAGGILYLHNINDTRTDAASPADWVHLSRLFGPSGAVVGRLVVVMTHWHDADGNEALLHQFNARKEELAEKWKGLIGAEPKCIEFYDTPESVQEAIELLLSDEAVTAPTARSTSPSPESKSQPRTPRPDSPPLIVPQPVHVQPSVVEPLPAVVEPVPTPPVIVEVVPEPVPEPPAVVEEKPVEPAPVVRADEPIEEVKVEAPPAPAPVAAEPVAVPTPAPAPPVTEPVPEPPVVADEPDATVRLVTPEPLPSVEEPVIPFTPAEPPSVASDGVPTPVVQEPTPATEVPSSDEAPKADATSPAPVPVPAADATTTGKPVDDVPATTASEPAKDNADADNRPSTIKGDQPDEKKVDEKDADADKDKTINEKQAIDEKTDEKTTSTISKGAPSEIPYGQEKIKIPWWRKLCCGCF